MNDEHIREIVKKMPDAVSPTAIQNAVNDYLDEHPVSGGTDETLTKEQVISILEGGN